MNGGSQSVHLVDNSANGELVGHVNKGLVGEKQPGVGKRPCVNSSKPSFSWGDFCSTFNGSPVVPNGSSQKQKELLSYQEPGGERTNWAKC